MPWPFVSREHFHYMRLKLEADVERERANFKRTLDYILERSAGSRLFDEVVRCQQPEQPVGYMTVKETAEHKSARERVRLIQEQVNAEQDESEAKALIDQTVDEGRKAANQ